MADRAKARATVQSCRKAMESGAVPGVRLVRNSSGIIQDIVPTGSEPRPSMSALIIRQVICEPNELARHPNPGNYNFGARTNAIRFFIEKGGNPNCRLEGLTPLLIYCKKNFNGRSPSGEPAMFLVKMRCDPDATDERGMTALEIAEQRGHEEIEAYLSA
jgi:hypothetical protein